MKEKKRNIRNEIMKRIEALSDSDLTERIRQVETRLFSFANFMESKIPLLYLSAGIPIDSRRIITRCYENNKIVVLPFFGRDKFNLKLLKVDDLETDLKIGHKGVLEPDDTRCKVVPIDRVDIALIPGIAFDEKGGRIGPGDGYYDRLIPRLASTTRKVALALECQVINQIPMASHDKHVDIIITENRIIYKI